MNPNTTKLQEMRDMELCKLAMKELEDCREIPPAKGWTRGRAP